MSRGLGQAQRFIIDWLTELEGDASTLDDFLFGYVYSLGDDGRYKPDPRPGSDAWWRAVEMLSASGGRETDRVLVRAPYEVLRRATHSLARRGLVRIAYSIRAAVRRDQRTPDLTRQMEIELA